MQEVISAFELSVQYLAEKLEDKPQLWERDESTDFDILSLTRIGVDYQTARNAVAVAKFYSTSPNNQRNMLELFTELVMEQGFCEEVVNAAIIWDMYMVRIPAHLNRFAMMPVELEAMLDDFIENGDIDPDELY